jgi:single-strand DNA-binding protein
MALPLVSTEFWVATEPELKFAPSGLANCKFRVKAAARVRQDDGSFKDGKTLWATAIVWSSQNKPFAENVYESIKKGDNVILTGPIYVRSYESNTETKMVVEIDVQGVGPSLTFRTTPHGAASGGGNKAAAASQGTSGTTTTQTVQQVDPATQPAEDGDPPF